jgi:CMP-N-acetylneuraminic acid synthetase
VRTVGLIPARGGSKRVPGKNLRWIAGKPLIFWTLEAALQSKLDAVYVSTEDDRIRDLCRDYCEIIHRPPVLSDDLATAESVIEHALLFAECDRIMLLQPTSPLRTSTHIDECLELPTAISVKKVNGYFQPNGAVYLMDRGKLMHYDRCYVMDKAASVDIDTLDEFELAEMLLLSRGA